MELLNILCIKREMSNLQSTYSIPAIFNMWKSEQQSLINGIKDKPVVIASDVRVDSHGHSGVFGSGSCRAKCYFRYSSCKGNCMEGSYMCNVVVEVRQCVIMVKHHIRHQ